MQNESEKKPCMAEFFDLKKGQRICCPIVDKKTEVGPSSTKRYTISGQTADGRIVTRFVNQCDYARYTIAGESDIAIFKQEEAAKVAAEKAKRKPIPAKCSFPKGWKDFSLEQKTEAIAKKFGRLNKWDDMYEIKRQKVYSNSGEEQCGFEIVVTPGHHFTYKGSCICRKEPIPNSEMDGEAIPEDLAALMRENVLLGRLPDSHSMNMLNPDIGGKTYKEAADKMFRYLDLLAGGYHVREVQWYMENDHPELFPAKSKRGRNR